MWTVHDSQEGMKVHGLNEVFVYANNANSMGELSNTNNNLQVLNLYKAAQIMV